jgi:hypothetical protein
MGTADRTRSAPLPQRTARRWSAGTGNRAKDFVVGVAFLTCLALLAGSAYLDLSIVNAPYPDLAWGFLESGVAVWAPVVAFVLAPWLVLRVATRRLAETTDYAKGCAWTAGCVPVLVLGVPAILASASLVSTWGYRDQVRAVASHFAIACSGGAGVAVAAPHVSGGASPVIVLDGEGNPGSWTAEAVQRGWSSLDPSQVQVVACIGPDVSGKEVVCHYSQGGTWTATTHQRKVTLVAASTGASLGGLAVTTGAACPDQKVVGNEGQSHDNPVPWDADGLWTFIRSRTGH